MKRYFTLIVFLFAISGCASFRKAQVTDYSCQSSREYVTTLEYLRAQKQLGLDDAKMRQIALHVSSGCTGAAKRFTKAFEILTKAEAGGTTSLELAKELAQKPEVYAQTFIGVFTRSYLSEYLDLDFKTSLSLARSLSTEYEGDPKIALKDFVELTEFCNDEKNVGLSKPRCGVIAGRIIKSAEKFKVSVAAPFKKLFQFTHRDERGPQTPIFEALSLCEEIVAVSPDAPDNFILAYKYATADKGLNYDMRKSVEFAKQLANISKFDPERMPAAVKKRN